MSWLSRRLGSLLHATGRMRRACERRACLRPAPLRCCVKRGAHGAIKGAAPRCQAARSARGTHLAVLARRNLEAERARAGVGLGRVDKRVAQPDARRLGEHAKAGRHRARQRRCVASRVGAARRAPRGQLPQQARQESGWTFCFSSCQNARPHASLPPSLTAGLPRCTHPVRAVNPCTNAIAAARPQHVRRLSPGRLHAARAARPALS